MVDEDGKFENLHYEQTESRLQHELITRERLSGPNHPDTATCLKSLAEFYEDQGKYELAEPLYQRALNIKEQASNSDLFDIFSSLNYLGDFYKRQGKYEQAEQLFQRALAKAELILGPINPGVSISLAIWVAFIRNKVNTSKRKRFINEP